MNKVILTGRLTKDGEIRSTESGKTVYTNSIAVNRNYKNADGNYDTDFFNFVYWNIGDKFGQYLTKGKQILLEGRVQNRTYENDKKEKKNITEIIVEHIELLSSTKHEENEVNEFSTMNTKTEYDDKNIVLEDKDLPF